MLTLPRLTSSPTTDSKVTYLIMKHWVVTFGVLALHLSSTEALLGNLLGAVGSTVGSTVGAVGSTVNGVVKTVTGTGSATADPIVSSFDGRTFEFFGKVGRFYNVIQDAEHQVRPFCSAVGLGIACVVANFAVSSICHAPGVYAPQAWHGQRPRGRHLHCKFHSQSPPSFSVGIQISVTSRMLQRARFGGICQRIN